MEYTLGAFVERLREVIYDNFPYEPEDINQKKHNGPNNKHPTPLHIKDVAFKNLPITVSENIITFDIGSDFAEANYPYYHILEDSETIRIKNKGTKRTKGSQDKIADKGKRDYGRITFNGKTFKQEYRRSVRNIQNRIGKARKYYIDSSGQVFTINERSNAYVNVHYRFIERILEQTLPFIASEFGMKRKGIQYGNLEEEFDMQFIEDEQDILNILDSFTEE